MKLFAAAALAMMPALGFASGAEGGKDASVPPGIDISSTVRIDWHNLSVDGHTAGEASGFEGKYIMLRVDGRIIDGLTYSWRQRLNKPIFNSSFFDGTDWIYLDYAFRNWNFQAGKEIVAIGGWEYDANPVDIFAASSFWNNINCYEFGVSASYTFPSSDRLMAQVVQSPFYTSDHRNMYGYSLLWSASHGFWKPIWSANLFEHSPGHYISYISLGNRFTAGNFYLDLDYLNRAASQQTFFFKDCSVIAQLGWHSENSRWGAAAKFTYDVNRTDKGADLTVLPGTEIKMAGADVEFFPLLKKRTSLRLHAGCFYSWGHNSNSGDMWQDKTLFATIGITWNFDIFKLN